MDKLKGLYLITDTILTPFDTILIQVEEALKGGARIIQLRDKEKSDNELENIAYSLQKIVAKYNGLFIINDRILLAKKINADGLHIGDEDDNIEKARDILKDKIIGVSCYGDINKAIQAEKKSANYVAFGAVFASNTKKNAKVIGMDIFKQAINKIKIPICAIGGINMNNISMLSKDINMKAIISDVWVDDIQDRARILSSYC